MNSTEANILKNESRKETQDEVLDVFVNILFSLYSDNCEHTSNQIFEKEISNKNALATEFALLDNMSIYTFYQKDLLEPEDCTHKEFVIDCGNCSFNYEGLLQDKITPLIVLCDTCETIEDYLYQFRLANAKINIHYSIYAHQPIADVACLFASLVDQKIELKCKNAFLIDAFLGVGDWLLIEDSWKSSVQYIGIMPISTSFVFNIGNNVAYKIEEARDRIGQTIKEKKKKMMYGNAICEKKVKEDPFDFIMHMTFGGSGIISASPSPYGTPPFPSNKTVLLKGGISYDVFTDEMNRGTEEQRFNYGSISDVSENEYTDVEKITLTQKENGSINSSDDSHPFMWLLYKLVSPHYYLWHEGLKGTGFDKACDNYFLSCYFMAVGQEEKAKKYLKEGNKEYSKFIHWNFSHVLCWIPQTAIFATLLDGGIYVGEVINSGIKKEKEDYQKHKEELYVWGIWALLGNIPFKQFVKIPAAKRIKVNNNIINELDKSLENNAVGKKQVSDIMAQVKNDIIEAEQRLEQLRTIRRRRKSTQTRKKIRETINEKIGEECEKLEGLKNQAENIKNELLLINQTTVEIVESKKKALGDLYKDLFKIEGVKGDNIISSRNSWFSDLSDFIHGYNLYGNTYDNMASDIVSLVQDTVTSSLVQDMYKEEVSILVKKVAKAVSEIFNVKLYDM